ncbi:MAG: selenium-dependent molybdenum cofactor biosynthesis protein YqeB [Tissierellia bacterium]|nr:selenium-dependent molybdenum cofactor biosynthesis protein YqeB [Tissierellia bacterium]
MREIVVFRGGGDLATGAVQKIHRAGFKVLILEVPAPLCVRRTVSLSEAVYERVQRVEDISAVRISSLDEMEEVFLQDKVPILIDPNAELIEAIHPLAIIDATIAKRNIGTNKSMAPISIALGPGYEAGVDVDYVVETNRGHHLGRLLFKGFAAENTGVPGVIGGYSKERVYYSPADGMVDSMKDIGDVVEEGQILAYVDEIPVRAAIRGLVRGMLRGGVPVKQGVKIADVDPRFEALQNCYTISDKSRSVGGAVLEAFLLGLKSLKQQVYQNDK